MEEKVNNLIEKIENDSLQYYMFDDVLNMLKDLLLSNKHFFYCNSEIFNKKLCKHQCESCYFKSK